MDRPSLVVLLMILVAAAVGVSPARVHAAAPENGGAVPATDDARRQKIEQKAAKLVGALKLADAGKAERTKAIFSDWLGVMSDWHKAHDAELGRLWAEWNKARA